MARYTDPSHGNEGTDEREKREERREKREERREKREERREKTEERREKREERRGKTEERRSREKQDVPGGMQSSIYSGGYAVVSVCLGKENR